MSCSFCGEVKVYAKGLCSKCYQRASRHGGDPSFVRVMYRNSAQCVVDGCNSVCVAKGLCEKHYRANSKRGDPISNFGYGDRRTHPAYEHWRQMRRSSQGRVKEWDDFWKFVSDVPPKPDTGRTFSKRYDDKSPWGPSNFRWVEVQPALESDKEAQRRWRSNNRMKSKGHSLRKYYGITLSDYQHMYELQGGRCAICGDHGLDFSESDGRSKTLAVDHDHSTGKVRELLCAACNKALGGFKDNPLLLKLAAAYLEKHKGPPCPLPNPDV